MWLLEKLGSADGAELLGPGPGAAQGSAPSPILVQVLTLDAACASCLSLVLKCYSQCHRIPRGSSCLFGVRTSELDSPPEVLGPSMNQFRDPFSHYS